MSQWETVGLGKIAESVTYGVTASATNEPCGPKFLRITDIQNGSVHWDQVPWCKCDARTVAEARLAPGDIVFARTGATTGKSFLIRRCPKDAVFASYLIRVRLRSSVEPRYVTHFFQTADYWAQIAKSARGVAQPGVNATTLKALHVPLPPLPEQRRIAEVLDRAEALRAKRRAALAKLDTLIQAIFLDMFGDPTSNPKRWPTAKYAEVLCVPLRNGVSPSTAGSVFAKVLTLSAITGNSFDLTAWKLAPFRTQPPPDQTVASADFLVCRGNGNLRLVGKGHFPPTDMPNMTFPDTIIAGRVAPGRISPTFLEALWNSSAVRRQIEALRERRTARSKSTKPCLRAFSCFCHP